ncbi:hypothetical protein EMIHUDRAFT_458028, partial [Emiliania huxleyi CCMP1516]|uniref:PD-(D/E)XK endonuclease-like domain-containing protein n=2 Tax=Emiliania huxleyi TaxID=2903 RepID=A0A0D3JIU5_EMIH1
MLFQPLFKAPAGPPFDHCDVSFSNSYVDFLLLRFVSGGGGAVVAELTVIDAKATGKVKVGAMVQVAYYALLLETLIATDPRLAGVRRHLRLARHGGVWLYGEAAPAPFLLREVRDKVDAFLRGGGGLRALLSRRRKQQTYRSQEWRLAPSCRNCGFHDDCRADALPAGARATLHALGLPLRDRRQLERAAGGASLDALVTLAAQPQPDGARRRLLSRSLQIGYAPDGQPRTPAGVPSPRVRALVQGNPMLTGQSSLTLPQRETVALFLTILEDPSARSAYAWALGVRERCPGKGAFELVNSSFIPPSDMIPLPCPTCSPHRPLQREGQR